MRCNFTLIKSSFAISIESQNKKDVRVKMQLKSLLKSRVKVASYNSANEGYGYLSYSACVVVFNCHLKVKNNNNKYGLRQSYETFFLFFFKCFGTLISVLCTLIDMNPSGPMS